MLKKILRVLGIFVAIIALAFSALLGYTIYSNKSADNAASDFCGTIRVGSEITSVLSRVEQSRSRMRQIKDENGYSFLFQGGIFHAGVCHVGVSNGKVISSNFSPEGD